MANFFFVPRTSLMILAANFRQVQTAASHKRVYRVFFTRFKTLFDEIRFNSWGGTVWYILSITSWFPVLHQPVLLLRLTLSHVNCWQQSTFYKLCSTRQGVLHGKTNNSDTEKLWTQTRVVGIEFGLRGWTGSSHINFAVIIVNHSLVRVFFHTFQ